MTRADLHQLYGREIMQMAVAICEASNTRATIRKDDEYWMLREEAMSAAEEYALLHHERLTDQREAGT